jgi:hypothetical protein
MSRISRHLSVVGIAILLALPATAATERADRDRPIGERVERAIKQVSRAIIRFLTPQDELVPPHP